MTTDGDGVGQTTAASGSATSRPVVRSTSNRMVAGVSGGLGEYANVDPVIFRVFFGVLSIFGVGILLYAACWLLMPDGAGERSILDQVLGRHGRRVFNHEAVLLLTGAAVFALVIMGETPENLALVAAIIVLAVVYHRRRREAPPPAAVPDGPTPPGADPQMASAVATAEETTTPVAAPWTAATPPAQSAPPAQSLPPTQPPAPVEPPRKDRYSWVLGFSAMTVLLLLAGLAAALDVGAGVDLPITTLLSLALVAMGVILLISVRWGRAYALIPLGVPLALVVSTSGGWLDRLHDGTGTQRWAPATVTQIDPTYRWGAGDVALDLSAVEFGGRTVDTRIEVGYGDVVVEVPDEVDVVLRASVDAGVLRLFGDETDGFDQNRAVVDTGPDGTGGGRLEIVARLGMGQLAVNRATS